MARKNESEEDCNNVEIASEAIPVIFEGPQWPGGNRSGITNSNSAMDLPSTSGTTTDWQAADTDSSLAPIMEALDENGHRYVGLVNQAMTCYLNSLIQTLYMTPEFRNALYEWCFSGAIRDEAKNIPCQLQKLFLLLQTSERGSLETTDLTASFGWDSNEAYDQHDVQELCRLMFDALERRWKKTQNSSLIQDLYRGTMQDFVKCLKCARENVRDDVFLDLPLAVKNFGAREAFKSVEEALRAFVKIEILNGSNSYFCENCNEKTEAHKGLRITQFSYLLTIQLKRFDFDYNTLHRIKLNDRMTFPEVLDLNEFVFDQTSNEGKSIYELFSIMVHAGSAAGGHYYAYIKNIDQGKWYCFNDSSVKVASLEDIETSFGGMSGGWSNSSTNAYMLMYRQRDKQRNAEFLRSDQFPTHLTELKDRWLLEEEQKQSEKEREAAMIRVIVEYNVSGSSVNGRKDWRIPLWESVSTVFDLAYAHFGLKVPKNCCRLIRSMSAYTVNFEESLENVEDFARKFSDVFNLPQTAYKPDLLLVLETRAVDGDFSPITPSSGASDWGRGRTVEMHEVDLEAKTVYPINWIHLFSKWKVGKVKEVVAKRCGQAEWSRIRIVIESFCTQDMILLDSIGQTFEVACHTLYGLVPKIFVDAGRETSIGDLDRSKPFSESLLCSILDCNKNEIAINVRLPSNVEMLTAGLDKDSQFTPVDEGVCGSPTSTVTSLSGFVPATALLTPVALQKLNVMEDIDVLTPRPSPDVSPSVSFGSDSPGPPPISIGNWPMEFGELPRLEDNDDTLSAHSNEEKSYEITIKRQTDQAPYSVLELAVDRRMLIKQLRSWLSNYLNIPVEQFLLQKHYGSGIYDSNPAETSTIENFDQIDMISLKLGAPLKENEHRVSVYHFDMNKTQEQLEHYGSKYFDMVVSDEMNGAQILGKCSVMLTKLSIEHKLPLLRIRQRSSKSNGQTSNLLNVIESNEKLIGDPPNKSVPRELYLQFLDVPDVCLSPRFCCFVRRWKPSTMELLPVHEISVARDASAQQMNEAIAHVLGIRLENMLISDIYPLNMSMTFPYAVSRLELLNECKFTTAESMPITENGLLLYCRDSTEMAKDLSEDEKKTIRIQDNAHLRQSSESIRRKERPLRIQMSSTIADDLD